MKCRFKSSELWSGSFVAPSVLQRALGLGKRIPDRDPIGCPSRGPRRRCVTLLDRPVAGLAGLLANQQARRALRFPPAGICRLGSRDPNVPEAGPQSSGTLLGAGLRVLRNQPRLGGGRDGSDGGSSCSWSPEAPAGPGKHGH